VQSSKYLTQLENFLFKINKKKISEAEFRLLLLGDEEKQLPFVNTPNYSRVFSPVAAPSLRSTAT
jgi:hypothetical protein